MSCSLVWADQRAPIAPHIPIPVYKDGDGIVFRPGPSTFIKCGTASDTGGGACRQLCPTPPPFESDPYDPWRDGSDGCGSSWRARDFGTYLYRYARWQREVQAPSGHGINYNEIVVDGRHWNAHLPTTIEAFFGGAMARAARAEFLVRYALDPDDYPLMTFDRRNWDQPFSLAD